MLVIIRGFGMISAPKISGPLAQSAEQKAFNLCVLSSILRRPTKFFSRIIYDFSDEVVSLLVTQNVLLSTVVDTVGAGKVNPETKSLGHW